MKNLLLIVVAGLAALAPISAVQAQPSPPESRSCDFTVNPGVGSLRYDPFEQQTSNIIPVTIQFRRLNDPGGAKAATVDIVFTSDDPELLFVELRPTMVVGAGSAEGLNQNILYNPSSSAPMITTPLITNSPPQPGVLRWTYTGNNDESDVFTITADVIILPNSNFSTSTVFSFDVIGGCNGTGGGRPFHGPLNVPGGLMLAVTVPSAMRARFYGTALDFGEVGDVSDSDPRRFVTGNILVESSDLYQVSLVTQNNYLMDYTGGNSTLPSETLEYEVNYLGQDGSRTAPWVTMQCVRAGIAPSGGVTRPIRATLTEGGDDEVPSPNYVDYIIITYTPQVGLPGAGAPCTP